MMAQTKLYAPSLWSLLRSAAQTTQQEKVNTVKTPDLVMQLIYDHALHFLQMLTSIYAANFYGD